MASSYRALYAFLIRDKFLYENFAWLNWLTLFLLTQHPAKMSQIMKRRRCSWSDSFLLEVLLVKTTWLPLTPGCASVEESVRSACQPGWFIDLFKTNATLIETASSESALESSPYHQPERASVRFLDPEAPGSGGSRPLKNRGCDERGNSMANRIRIAEE